MPVEILGFQVRYRYPYQGQVDGSTDLAKLLRYLAGESLSGTAAEAPA